ncbi:hypothetical protein E3P99_02700 [Wallemia hederae]|uniref:Uncharacterized protein n=1 Tax=Wallemia hederae TaxID=1540922 RepID=A0A4T0FLG3_9BASI|nr:hypothetical protein E3P99_02700 [Wallemia hederae]
MSESPFKARVRHYTDSGTSSPSNQRKDIERRKIADLEISNKALLSINHQLEQTRIKHVKQIKELKQQLAQLQQQRRSPSPSSLVDFVEEDDADESMENDTQFNKIRWSIQDLIEQGKDALAMSSASSKSHSPA